MSRPLRLLAARAATVALPAPASAASRTKELPADVYRIDGATPAAVAAAFARDRFTAPLPTAFLVTSAGFADALAVAPEAAKRVGAMFFVEKDRIPAETESVLRDLDPAAVVIIGGEGAVSAPVATRAREITGRTPGRVAGVDRYATAAEIAKRFSSLPADYDAVFLASGVGFADALGGASAAASEPEVPLLLTDKATLPAATSEQIRRLAPATVYVFGGTGAVSDDVVAAVRALGPAVERVAGVDRYETAARLATTIFGDATEAIVATGTRRSATRSSPVPSVCPCCSSHRPTPCRPRCRAR